jgi:hypothetical protein
LLNLTIELLEPVIDRETFIHPACFQLDWLTDAIIPGSNDNDNNTAPFNLGAAESSVHASAATT